VRDALDAHVLATLAMFSPYSPSQLRCRYGLTAEQIKAAEDGLLVFENRLQATVAAANFKLSDELMSEQ
jgi:hypothetical protein